MFDTSSHTGYDIVKIREDRYAFFASGRKQFEGTLAQLFYVTVKKFGFQFAQVEEGVTAMDSLDHDKAMYGYRKTFMFSVDSNEAAA